MYSDKDQLKDNNTPKKAAANYDNSSHSVSPPTFQLKAESGSEKGEEQGLSDNSYGGSFQLGSGVGNINPSAGVIQGFGIPDWMKDAGSAISDGVSTAWDGAKHVGGAIADTGSDALRHTGNAVGNVAGGLWDGAKNVGGGLWDGAQSVGGGLVDGAKDLGGGLLDGARSIGGGLWDGAKNIGGGLWGGAKDIGGGLLDGVKSIGGGILDGGASMLGGDFAGGLSQMGNGLLGGVSSVGGGLWDGLKSIGGGLWDGAKDVGGGLLGGVQSAAGGLWDGVKSVGGGLWDGIKDVGSGLGGGLMSVLGGGAKALNNILNLGIDSTAGFLDNLLGPTGTQVDQSAIPKSHQFDEFMTDLAYLGDGKHWEEDLLSDVDRLRLEAHGYNASTFHVHYGHNGLQIITVQPREDVTGVNPYVSVRGSEANAENGGADWGSDFEYDQVGDLQYESNEDMIRGIMEGLTTGPDGEVGGQVDISGHSLGGALAQRITANYPGLVGRLTTFQAPGQSQQVLDTYNENTAGMEDHELPDINHHIALDGTVYKTGEQNLPGNYYVHDTGLDDLYSTHVATLVDQDGRTESATSHSVERFEEHPNPHVRMLHEFLRKQIGRVAAPALQGAHDRWGEN